MRIGDTVTSKMDLQGINSNTLLDFTVPIGMKGVIKDNIYEILETKVDDVKGFVVEFENGATLNIVEWCGPNVVNRSTKTILECIDKSAEE